MDRSSAEDLLRRALGDPRAAFRNGQWEAIDAIANHRRKLLVVQRTGWGKSLVYFIATRILRDRRAGPTLIVSPLLALMRNQLDAAARLGIRAVTINSANQGEWPGIIERVLAEKIDAVLISPERLANQSFVEDVLRPLAERIGLLVVDEVHCISDWGHDFRPDYRRIGSILRLMPPNMPVLGTTATANDRVIRDVSEQLGNLEISRGPLVRESLALQTLRLSDQTARLAWLAAHIPEMPGTGIIYALTRRDAEQVAAWLRKNGIDARAYYSDVELDGYADSNAARLHLETLLLENRLKVLVATTALGMGYDKPDLGFVVHYQAPGSIVAYYQQVGRAGRAVDSAYGILLSGREDDDIHEYFRGASFPPEGDVLEILSVLEAHDGLSVRALEAYVNLRHGQIEQVLKYLSVEQPAPVFKDGSQWRRAAVPWQMDRAKIQRLTEQREREWQEVQRYIDGTGCLMAFLRSALDDPGSEDCGRCARCRGEPLIGPTFPHGKAVEAAEFLRRTDVPLKTRTLLPRAAFETYGLQGGYLPKELRAEPGKVLCHWGDAGWGQTVLEDKHTGHFRDELVAAAADMIRSRWRPDPPPAWVTCVPSLRHPELVPSFARRLADRLSIPFHEVIRKVRDTPPQKSQENTFHQCRNLDGAFEIAAAPQATPVLLVDDVADSRWTLTIVAALLRRAGSGAVFPMALASSGGSD